MSIPFQHILSQSQVQHDIILHKAKKPEDLLDYISTVIPSIMMSSSSHEDIIKDLLLELDNVNVPLKIVLSALKTLKEQNEGNDEDKYKESSSIRITSPFLSLLVKCINSIKTDIKHDDKQHKNTKIQRNLLQNLLDLLLRSGNVSLITFTILRDVEWSRSLLGNLEDLTRKTIITLLLEMLDFTFINCKRQFPSVLYQSSLLFKDLSSLLTGKEDILTEYFDEVFKFQSSIPSSDFILLSDCLSLLGMGIWNSEILKISLENYILKMPKLDRSIILFLLKGDNEEGLLILQKHLQNINDIDKVVLKNSSFPIKAKTSFQEEKEKIDIVIGEIFSNSFQTEYDFKTAYKTLPALHGSITNHSNDPLYLLDSNISIDTVIDYDVLFELLLRNDADLINSSMDEERMRRFVISILLQRTGSDLPKEMFQFAISYLRFFSISRAMVNEVRRQQRPSCIAPIFFRKFVIFKSLDSLDTLLSFQQFDTKLTPSDIPSMISIIIESSSYDKEFTLSMNKLSKQLCSPIKWALDSGSNDEFINSFYEVSIQWCFLSTELSDQSIRISSILLLHKSRIDTFEERDGIVVANDSLWRSKDAIQLIKDLLSRYKTDQIAISLCEVLLCQEWLDYDVSTCSATVMDDLIDIFCEIISDSFAEMTHLIVGKLNYYHTFTNECLTKSLYSLLQHHIEKYENGVGECGGELIILKDLRILLSIELSRAKRKIPSSTAPESFISLYAKWKSSSTSLEVSCNTMLFELCLLSGGNGGNLEWYMNCINDFSIINGRLECENESSDAGAEGDVVTSLLSSIKYKAISFKSIQSLMVVTFSNIKAMIDPFNDELLSKLLKKKVGFVDFEAIKVVEHCSLKFIEIGNLLQPFLGISFSSLPLHMYHCFLREILSLFKGITSLIEFSMQSSAYTTALITLLGPFITGSLIGDIYSHLPLAQQSFQEEERSKHHSSKKAKVSDVWISKLIPNLIFSIEKCEKCIISLHEKLDLAGEISFRDELVSFMKVSTSRDFRIQIEDLPPTQYPSAIVRGNSDSDPDSDNNDAISSDSSSSICPSTDEDVEDQAINLPIDSATELTLEL